MAKLKRLRLKNSPNCDHSKAERVNDAGSQCSDAIAMEVTLDSGEVSDSCEHTLNEISGRTNGNSGIQYKVFPPHSKVDTVGIEDKFANSILHAGSFGRNVPNNIDTQIHHKWREQSQFNFGFVPIDEQKCQKPWWLTNALTSPPLTFIGG